MARYFFMTIVLLSSITAFSQGPDADWRTLKTPHFRVHYPVELEAWTVRAVEKMESIRAAVVEEVGYEPEDIVDILVMDPFAQPNGMALPILRMPRMILFASPPGSDSIIGHYRDWPELLTVHEETHLVHMLRPSRNPFDRFLSRIFPIGPINKKAPRWVLEGYATLIEGKLTGAGRPNSDIRASILRRWAQSGKLPTYGRLGSDTESWLGMSMAYLVGSAYLEWLVMRSDPDSLRHLWARMSARKDRSLDDAFEGVFGDSPKKLYRRFTAELTYRAMEIEGRLVDVSIEGDLWQDLAWTTGAPAISPDGQHLAIILRHRKKPSKIIIWSTGPDEEAEKKWIEMRDRLLLKDSEDVPAIRSKPLKRKPLFKLPTRNWAEPFMPRWMPDGKSILYVRYEPDSHGFLHPDIFQWTPSKKEVRRLTYLADVQDPHPSPDGKWAAAIRNLHGFSQLVRVDLSTGDVMAMTEPSLDIVYDHPGIDPTGMHLAYVRHSESAWRLMILDLSTGDEIELPTPTGGMVAHPAWSPDGQTIYAAVGSGGFVEIHAFPLDPEGKTNQITRSSGASLAPTPTPDGKGLFYLSLEADGLDLRYLDLGSAGTDQPPIHIEKDLAPAVRPMPPESTKHFETFNLSPADRYGFGKQEFKLLMGGNASPSLSGWDLGIRGGDIVGRLDYLALLSLSDKEGLRGGTLAGAWRGWPVELSLQLFDIEERPSEQSESVPGLSRMLDIDRRGLEVRASWDFTGRIRRFEIEGGGLWNRIKPSGHDAMTQHTAFVETSYTQDVSSGLWRFPQGIKLSGQWGKTSDDSWHRLGGKLRFGIVYDKSYILFSWQRHSVRGDPWDFDRLQLGGMPHTILPDSTLVGRILVPALPLGTLTGDDHEGQRLSLHIYGLAFPVFYERHRMWDRDGQKGEWLELAGIQWRIESDALPIIKLPGFIFNLGAAYIFDKPFKDKIHWWVGITWKP